MERGKTLRWKGGVGGQKWFLTEVEVKWQMAVVDNGLVLKEIAKS